MSQGALAGRVAVVTGASRKGSIGRGICLALAEQGASIVVSDVGRPLELNPGYPVASTEELEDTVRELEALGTEAIGVRCDVTKSAEVKALVDAAVQRFGKLDIWVNNAGVAVGSVEITEVEEKDLQLTLDVNLKGVFFGVQAAARQLVAQGGGGRIISIASQAGKTGWPLLSAYSASKFGVIGLTQSAAKELGRFGITVNAVCPGTVDTALLSSKDGAWEMNARRYGITPAEVKEQTLKEIPLGRLQTPRDVANAVCFLASDAADYITGEALNSTGGQEMH